VGHLRVLRQRVEEVRRQQRLRVHAARIQERGGTGIGVLPIPAAAGMRWAD
jgi:hypothetical protein